MAKYASRMTQFSQRKPIGTKRRTIERAYHSPPAPIWKRALRSIFNPWTAIFGLIVLLACIGIFAFYWQEYSETIDRRLLSGDIFTPTAGIY
ncbi:MAG: hypothetical protein C4325_02775, partial [Blastocatellia bacterium]